jgi:rhamnosyltransferase
MSTKAPRVSVVMRTKNADWVVGQALAALHAQSYDDFELIVVDSGSTDRTLDHVRAYACDLVQIAPEDYYPGPVLNMAIERARGEIVVFQNSDVVPLDPDCLGRLVAAFDDEGVQAAFARQVPRPEAHAWVRHDYEKAFPVSGEAPTWMTYSLPFAAMRRDLWLERPFYDDAWASEDTEWGSWARRNGHRIAYVPDAAVMHSHNYTLRQLYGRRFVEGEADAFIYQGRAGAWSVLARTVTSTAADLLYQIRGGHRLEPLVTPARRFVFHFAYHRGHRLGERRRACASGDVGIGQRAVLSRYG